MKTQGILFAFLDAAAFMLSTSFVFYVTSIIIPFLRHKPAVPGDPSGFEWHFVIPCLDEERVIEGTVIRLRSRFPDSHVWCVDDGSGDDTPVILSRLAAGDRRVHVVTRRLPDAQLGKGPALNSAWEAINVWAGPAADASRLIVAVVDADGDLDPNCLRALSGTKYFGDPEISAVQIQVRVRNQTEQGRTARLLVRLQDMEFTSVIAAIQMLRHNIGSVGMGGNGQFTRLSALNLIAVQNGEPWKKALIEDFELGLHILMSGGHNEYCHETWVWQQGPSTFSRLVRQRSRWGQGVMQCWRYYGPVLRSPNIPTAAAMEITYFLCLPWMQVFGDLIYLVAALALLYEAISVHGGLPAWLAGAGGWQVVPVFLIFGVGPMAIWGPIYRRRIDPELGRIQAILLGFVNWPYILVHHCAAWWAFIRMVRSRHDWKKTERLDERPLVVAGVPSPGAGVPSPAFTSSPAPPSSPPLEAAEAAPASVTLHFLVRDTPRVRPLLVPGRIRAVPAATKAAGPSDLSDPSDTEHRAVVGRIRFTGDLLDPSDESTSNSSKVA